MELRLTHPVAASRGLPACIRLENLPLVLGRKPEGPNIQALNPSNRDLRMAISRTHCSIMYPSTISAPDNEEGGGGAAATAPAEPPVTAAGASNLDVAHAGGGGGATAASITGGTLEVMDHSRNGLYVNHKRIGGNGKATIRPGDLITFGSYANGRRSEQGVTYVLAQLTEVAAATDDGAATSSSPSSSPSPATSNADPEEAAPAIAVGIGGRVSSSSSSATGGGGGAAVAVGASSSSAEATNDSQPVVGAKRKRGGDDIDNDNDDDNNNTAAEEEGGEAEQTVDITEAVALALGGGGAAAAAATDGGGEKKANSLQDERKAKIAKIIADQKKAAAASLQQQPEVEEVSLTVNSEQLTCGICLEPIATAAHTSCGHSYCFRCLHKLLFHRYVQDSGAWGFEPDFRCATCRSKIYTVARNLFVDDLSKELVQRSKVMTAEEKEAWEKRKADGQAIAQAYQESHFLPRNMNWSQYRVDVRVEYSIQKGRKKTNCRGCEGKLDVGTAIVKVYEQRVSPMGQINLGILGRGTGAHFWHMPCLREKVIALVTAQRKSSRFCRLRFRVRPAAKLAKDDDVRAAMATAAEAEFGASRDDWPWWVHDIKARVGTDTDGGGGGAAGGGGGAEGAQGAGGDGLDSDNDGPGMMPSFPPPLVYPDYLPGSRGPPRHHRHIGGGVGGWHRQRVRFGLIDNPDDEMMDVLLPDDGDEDEEEEAADLRQRVIALNEEEDDMNRWLGSIDVSDRRGGSAAAAAAVGRRNYRASAIAAARRAAFGPSGRGSSAGGGGGGGGRGRGQGGAAAGRASGAASSSSTSAARGGGTAGAREDSSSLGGRWRRRGAIATAPSSSSSSPPSVSSSSSPATRERRNAARASGAAGIAAAAAGGLPPPEPAFRQRPSYLLSSVGRRRSAAGRLTSDDAAGGSSSNTNDEEDEVQILEAFNDRIRRHAQERTARVHRAIERRREMASLRGDRRRTLLDIGGVGEQGQDSEPDVPAILLVDGSDGEDDEEEEKEEEPDDDQRRDIVVELVDDSEDRL